MRTSVYPWVVTAALVLVAGIPGPALAAVPANDTRAGAVDVAPLPFSYTQDTSEATASGPRRCGNSGSVFFRFVPDATGRVQVDTFGSDYDTTLAVFVQTGGRRTFIGCNDDRIGLTSGLRFRALQGVEYFLRAGVCCGSGDPGGGTLVLNVGHAPTDALAATMTIDGGFVDPDTGLATLTGSLSCNRPANVYLSFQLRQMREGVFVARTWVERSVACAPGTSAFALGEVDTDTGIAFGAGSARIRWFEAGAYDGYREQLDLMPADPVQAVTLT